MGQLSHLPVQAPGAACYRRRHPRPTSCSTFRGATLWVPGCRSPSCSSALSRWAAGPQPRVRRLAESSGTPTAALVAGYSLTILDQAGDAIVGVDVSPGGRVVFSRVEPDGGTRSFILKESQVVDLGGLGAQPTYTFAEAGNLGPGCVHGTVLVCGRVRRYC